MIAAADKSLSLADDYTKIVAGHGPLGNKADLMKSRDMLTTSRDRIEKLTSTGKSALEAVAEKPVADLDSVWGQGIINSEQWVRLARHPPVGRNNAISVRLVRHGSIIRVWHSCGTVSKNLELYRTFALSSTPFLRWYGPVVQRAPQTSSISAGWTIPVYLQSKLWARDGRLRFIQTTCHEFWKHTGKL